MISSQCWLISGFEIWGGPKAYILKSGGAVAPPAPLIPPPMLRARKFRGQAHRPLPLVIFHHAPPYLTLIPGSAPAKGIGVHVGQARSEL